MPGRTHPLITDHTYHIFNRTIEHKMVFEDSEICRIFLDIVWYYRSSYAHLRFSNFRKLPQELKQSYEKKINDKRSFRVSILAYCIMPTHYHFLLRQNQTQGISFYISQIQNSFTRYLNLKYERAGPIFLHTFRSKPIQSEEQLKHVSRYIHLNPFSSGIVADIENLSKYPWSSFKEYVFLSNHILSDPTNVLSFFANNRERYKRFVLDNGEHQKMLEYCKYSNRW